MRSIVISLTLPAVLFFGAFLTLNFAGPVSSIESALPGAPTVGNMASFSWNLSTPAIDSKFSAARYAQKLVDGLSITSITTGGAWIKKLALRIFNLDQLRSMIFAFPLWVALIFTLTLERIIPAEPKQKILSVSFAHDLMWFLYEPVLNALVTGTYVALLAKIHKTYFSYLTLSVPTVTPGWIRFTVALLLLDLGYWVQHYINHKVPFLWKLHAVHHSQRQLNFFTDFRYHPLEYVVRHTFITVPFFFFSVTPPVIVGFAVAKEWYSRFYHGNIRTNLGILKYVLVTPQSHRVHHSFEARHLDMNFGAIFTFWDFLFRKQYMGFDEYPATGIHDERFPYEQKISPMSLILTPWLQILHPFSRRSETRSQ